MGDGGGGPKDESIEWGRRMADLEGTPRVRFGTARDFFARLGEHADRLPVWVGELYLELHRGTLTTQAAVKKANRKLENRLRAVEFLWSCLPLEGYPAARLDAIWKEVLRNQFHDILPGSSIAMTYEVTHREYRDALGGCESLLADAADRLFVRDETAIVLCNPLHGTFRGAIPLPGGWDGYEVLDRDGATLAVQQEVDHAVARVTIPPYSFATLRQGASASASDAEFAHGEAGPAGTAHAGTATGKSTRVNAARTSGDPTPQEFVLENDRVRYTLAADATIREAIDRGSGRPLLEPGRPGNVLTLYEDRPNNWDAWDVDLFYEGAVIETARGVEATPLPGGPVRRGLRFRLAIGDSEIEQIVSLEVGSTRLDFDTRVRWRERHRMLRVAFPIAVRAESATFDIQYGFIRRPTHRNTLWDQARFESVAHRYVDLSEATHGVALLNNGKYGHKVLDNVIDLNLLRSPTYPDPDADRGEHRFTYSLYPHEGDLEGSDVIERAAELNMGVLSFPGYAVLDKQGAVDLDILAPPVWVEGDGLSMETLKKAERDNSLIVRLVETRGRASEGTLHATPNRYTICETNLLEWEDGALEPVGGPIQVVLRPFEIRTYRLRPTEVTR